MKEMPERIYLFDCNDAMVTPLDGDTEYIRKDSFIEKACKKLEKCMYDNLMFQGRLHRKEVIETFIEDFKKHLEEQV